MEVPSIGVPRLGGLEVDVRAVDAEVCPTSLDADLTGAVGHHHPPHRETIRHHASASSPDMTPRSSSVSSVALE